MTLQELMFGFDRVRLAKPSDNAEILELYESQAMNSGGLTLSYSRKGDFFRFTKHQGKKSFTFLFCNSNGSIGGLATYVLSEGWIEGSVKPMGYMCDARVSRDADKETKEEWRRFYVHTVMNSHLVEEFEYCEYMFSAILDANKIALRAFKREESPLEFSPSQKYQAFQVMGKKWFRSKPSPFNVRKIAAHERQKLYDFLQLANRKKSLGFTGSELSRRETNWNHFSWESFLICTDSEGHWLAVTAPKSFSDSRSLVVEKATPTILLLSHLARLFGGPSLKENQELETTYLTHLEFAPHLTSETRLNCVGSFIDLLFTDIVTKKGHLLSFYWPAKEGVACHRALSKYLIQSTSGTYYQIYPKTRADKLRLFSDLTDISFEVGLA
ncbi:MAG: hypothetical protein R2827_01975 [Bdellovibrionales bacterium]